MPDDWKLLAIERIFDCRCAAAPPARARNALSRVCGMAPQMLQPRRQGRGRHGERMHHGGGYVRERRVSGGAKLACSPLLTFTNIGATQIRFPGRNCTHYVWSLAGAMPDGVLAKRSMKKEMRNFAARYRAPF